MKLIKLAWRQTWRDLAAGEIRLMLLALVIAVMAVTAVSFITDRAELGLQQEANRLLGGDAALLCPQSHPVRLWVGACLHPAVAG